MKSWLRHQPKRTCARRRPGKTGVLVTAASVLALTAFGSPARAALVYMSVSGVGLVYDMSANTAWLQDADLADWLTGRRPIPDSVHTPLIVAIREAALKDIPRP